MSVADPFCLQSPVLQFSGGPVSISLPFCLLGELGLPHAGLQLSVLPSHLLTFLLWENFQQSRAFSAFLFLISKSSFVSEHLFFI